MFAEKGFHRATTREIAETANVSEGTTYNYFASKDDLLIGIMTRLGEQQQPDEVLAQALHGDARDWFITVYRLRQEFMQQHGATLQAVLSEVLINRGFSERYYREIMAQLLKLTEQYIQAQIERGQIRQVNAACWAARILFAINIGLTLRFVVGDPLLLSEMENPDETFFDVRYWAQSDAEAREWVRAGRVKGAIIVPGGFAEALQQGR